MILRRFGTVTLSGILLMQTTTAIAQNRNCWRQQTKDQVEYIMDGLGVAGALLVSRGEAARFYTLGDIMEHSHLAWDVGKYLIDVCVEKPSFGLPAQVFVGQEMQTVRSCIGPNPPWFCSPSQSLGGSSRENGR